MSNKISIRFYKDHKVRAIWDEGNNKWWFSVVDIIAAINEESDYQKSRNYWKYLNPNRSLGLISSDKNVVF